LGGDGDARRGDAAHRLTVASVAAASAAAAGIAITPAYGQIAVGQPFRFAASISRTANPQNYLAGRQPAAGEVTISRQE
jgi:hypothetical protein